MRLREKASGQTGQWELTGLWKTLEQNSEREREIEIEREREQVGNRIKIFLSGDFRYSTVLPFTAVH